jgi:hypothetical protein
MRGSRLLAVIVAPLTVASAVVATADDPQFQVALDSCSYGGSAVADLDNDGELEILFGTYYNDERVVALDAGGTVHWALPSGGGPVDGSVTVADLDRDGSPEVMWGNSGSTRFHVADSSGGDLWSFVTGEVLDAPAAVGDVNGDGRLDIVLASCGSDATRPGLRAFTGISGQLLWSAAVSGCYQSAPLLFDQNRDGYLDVVVSTWFGNRVRAFSGRDGSLRWEATIGDWTYHAGSFGDLDHDGVPDVALGDYSATLWALDGNDGHTLWSRPLAGETYIFGPTAMGDLDGDGSLEVVVTGNRLAVFESDGTPGMSFALPGFCSRGPVLVDYDGNGSPDILLAMDGPVLAVYSGVNGALLYSHTFPTAPGMDHQPAVWDADHDGVLEAFTVYGRGESTQPELNWGAAVLMPLGAAGHGWPTFSHDHHHSGNYDYPPGAAVNDWVFSDGFDHGHTGAWSVTTP